MPIARLGRLDQRVAILRAPAVRDRAGQPIEGIGGDRADWPTIAVLWAEVRDLSAREVEVGARLQLVADLVVETRSLPPELSPPLATDRIRWRDQVYHVADVREPDGDPDRLIWKVRKARPSRASD